jgi:hypothetical protein
VPDPSSPPSNEGTAPASSTSPGAGDASPASHPATTNPLLGGSAGPASVGGARPVVAPIVNGTETARGLQLPALSGNGTASSPFTLGPAPLPSSNAGAHGISNELAAPLPATRGASTDGSGGLPRPGAPITLAVLLVAGVLGAHGVRWIDRQMATATVTTTTR